MIKTVSGEEHKALVEQTKRRPFDLLRPAIFVAAGLVIAGLSFALGIQYQKDHIKTISSNTVSQNGSGAGQQGMQNGFGGRRRFGGQRPLLGQVTAVDASSITINAQNSTSTIFAITATTTITDNGQQSTVAAIKIGDNVAIVASPTDAKQAARILLNPNLGGTPPAGASNMTGPSSVN